MGNTYLRSYSFWHEPPWSPYSYSLLGHCLVWLVADARLACGMQGGFKLGSGKCTTLSTISITCDLYQIYIVHKLGLPSKGAADSASKDAFLQAWWLLCSDIIWLMGADSPPIFGNVP